MKLKPDVMQVSGLYVECNQTFNGEDERHRAETSDEEGFKSELSVDRYDESIMLDSHFIDKDHEEFSGRLCIHLTVEQAKELAKRLTELTTDPSLLRETP